MKEYGCPECGHFMAITDIKAHRFHEFGESKGSKVSESLDYETESKFKCCKCGHEFDEPKEWVTFREGASL